MSKKQTRHIVARNKGHIIELWIPPVDHPEGELICAIDYRYTQDMIAALRSAADARLIGH